MWDEQKAFNTVLDSVNKMNQFKWKHQYVFNGIKKHNPKLYENITKAQNDIDNSFTAKDEIVFNAAIKEFERLINEVWLIYTGRRVRECQGN